MAITLTDNEFLTGLSNLALNMRLYATNNASAVSAFVDSFMTEPIANGNTKIFPWQDIPDVSDYAETSSVLTVTKPKAGEEYIQITQRKVIASSYSAQILRMAFTDERGCNVFIGYQLGLMESARVNHMYNDLLDVLFGKTFTGISQNHEIETYDLSGITSFMELRAGSTYNQETIALAIENDLQNMQIFSPNYNGLGNTEALDVGDLKLIFCEPYHNKSVIELYGTLLNSQIVKNSFKQPSMYTIPTLKIPTGQDKVIGWLMHKSALQAFYKFTFMGNFFDVSNLVVNNFLHFWYGRGWLENLPAVKLTAADITLPTA